MKRPILEQSLSYQEFINHYYLKEELVAFCKKNGLVSSGNKEELTIRISLFLNDGIKQKGVQKKNYKVNINEIHLDMIIEDNFVCSEKHRSFFIKEIGTHFKFKVIFQKWLKNNSGKKTYREAVLVYQDLIDNNKHCTISKQFEYNQYIRDFFADNDGMSLKEAIICWYYKRDKKGPNKYDKSDLVALLNK